MKGRHLNPFQHALKRPDAYIGSILTTQELRYVYEDDCVVTRPVTYNRGLMNIIREIGSNCIDHKWRSLKTNFHVKGIKVEWDGKTGRLSFWNDGSPIPIELCDYEYEVYKKGENKKKVKTMYPSEALFGEFLTGTNFEDDQERKTSGRNGMGSKVCVVFSSEFIVDNVDTENGKKFYQEYSENGKHRTEPKVTSYKGKTNYTQISFIPDFERFGYPVVQPSKKSSRSQTDADSDVESSFDISEESNESESEKSENEFDDGWAAQDEEEKPKKKKSNIKFSSDLERDFVGVLGIYVLEIAGVTALPVTFVVNGVTKKFHFKTFDKYVRMFFPSVQNNKLANLECFNNDECVIVESHVDPTEIMEETLDTSRHISFVNGINTRDGGVHVDAWREAIFPSFVRAFNAKSTKGNALKTTAKEVYPYLTLFLRTEVDKPAFDHNTKDKLNGPDYHVVPEGNSKSSKEWRTEFKENVDNLVKKMLKWNFTRLLEEKLLAKTGNNKITKARSRVDGGDKVLDAGLAGRRPELCTLWITEGLSAKALVVRGISCIEDGHDTNGILAIRGKFLNIRTSSMKTILANKEIQLSCAMLNLKIGVKYDTEEKYNTLRYHQVRFATDMDDDGIHIRGLLINFFYTYWPELFDKSVFSSLSTAVTKITFSPKLPAQLFFSNPEFNKWYTKNMYKVPQHGVKYLKGLGSINPDDAPDYFLDPKIVNYYTEGDEKDYMFLGYEGNKEARGLRKVWLVRDMIRENRIKLYPSGVDNSCYESRYIKDTEESEKDDEENELQFIYEGDLSVSQFVDCQLVIYHKTAMERALPGFMDSLKNGQRKAVYAILKKKYKVPQNLENVMGAIKDMTGYHHGAKSLNDTVVKLAAKYPGSNNISLFVDDGEFGTRIHGGEDHSAGRYIATKERKIARKIFRDEDIPLLTKTKSDGKDAEYQFFLPTINLLLINGCEGIASGFSSEFPMYHPMKILEWQRAWLEGKHGGLDRLIPWYRGIDGPIELVYKNEKSKDPIKWKTSGILVECCKKCDIVFKYRQKGSKKILKKKCPGQDGWWHITDAPVGLRTDKLKAYLTYLETGKSPEGKKWKKLPKKCITDFKEYYTANFVHFYIKPTKDWEPSIDNTLKILSTTHPLTNMVAIDANNYPTRYKSPEHVLEEWCPVRLAFYKKRHDYIIRKLKHEKLLASNRYIFVKAVGVDKTLDLYQEDEVVEELLTEMKLDKMSSKLYEENEKDEEEGEDKKGKEPSYDYLLQMQMRSMTKKKLEELKKEIDKAKEKIKEMKDTPFEQLWVNDMNEFEKAWDEYLKDTQLI